MSLTGISVPAVVRVTTRALKAQSPSSTLKHLAFGPNSTLRPVLPVQSACQSVQVTLLMSGPI